MSEIRATTISDAAGTGPITLTKQSAAKAWLSNYYDNGGTIGDSFGVSSVTDVGTGACRVNFGNSFDSVNFSHTASDNYYGMCQTEPSSQTVSSGLIATYSNTFVLIDTVKNSVAHGDLA